MCHMAPIGILGGVQWYKLHVSLKQVYSSLLAECTPIHWSSSSAIPQNSLAIAGSNNLALLQRSKQIIGTMPTFSL